MINCVSLGLHLMKIGGPSILVCMAALFTSILEALIPRLHATTIKAIKTECMATVGEEQS
jgi:hypothetical protein